MQKNTCYLFIVDEPLIVIFFSTSTFLYSTLLSHNKVFDLPISESSMIIVKG